MKLLTMGAEGRWCDHG